MPSNSTILAGVPRQAPVGQTIFKWVTGCHAAAVLIILGYSWIQSLLTPKELVIPVTMIELPASTEAHTSTAVSPSVPQTPSPPATPTPRLRTPEEIRQSTLTPISSQQRPVTTAAASQPIERRSPDIDTTGIADRLQSAIDQVNVTIALPSATSNPPSRNELERYLGAISSVLYQAWEQPTAAAVPRHQRKARVQLTVSADGSIINAKLLESSGNVVMDRTVMNIFKKQKKLPPPRSYGISEPRFTVTIAFTLD